MLINLITVNRYLSKLQHNRLNKLQSTATLCLISGQWDGIDDRQQWSEIDQIELIIAVTSVSL